MLVRELKLKLNKGQEEVLKEWLWHLTGVFNWASRKIELDAKDRNFYSKMEFQNLLVGHSKKLGIPAQTIQGVLTQAWTAWDRCFNKISKKPHLKSIRNKLNSIQAAREHLKGAL